MKVKELNHIIRVGTVVESRIFGTNGVISKVTMQPSKDNVTTYVRFEVLWLDGKTTAAYQHENSFEVKYTPSE